MKPGVSVMLLKVILLLSVGGMLAFGVKDKVSVSGNKQSLKRQPGTMIISTDDTGGRKEVPVIPGDFADPTVIRRGNLYYATGTSSEWAPHFPLFTSTDLYNWKQLGYVFDQLPAWASSSFWAPELFYWKGTYYLYYVARKKSDGISCIGVATSKDPAKGFTDKGIVVEFGKEAIDPFVLEDNGQLYMTWKAYGLDQRPIEILGAPLSDDGLKLTGEPFLLLRDDDKQGLEGQCLVKRNGYYYLFYSPGACCGRGCSYKTEVARSASLKGPYTRYSANPLLAETEDWKCTGHGTLVRTNAGKDFYLYHAYSKTADVFTGRQGMLAEVTWDPASGWPAIHPLGKKASIQKIFRDDFSSRSLAGSWQWDFRHATPVTKLQNGALSLSGKVTPNNPAGVALTVRPIASNYEMTTEVVQSNGSLQGLVLYGDASQAVGIGVKGSRVAVWETKKGVRSVLKDVQSGNYPVQLKMVVDSGSSLRFYWRAKGEGWNELHADGAPYNGDFLPPWDRSPRPGLLQQGTTPATFNFFKILYK
ncbi:family 43 glycosylhydrolase [Flavisolibacter sp. BT320]|nr:family 43 glycosylhydrolase [Flavisolibacter longurius]